MNFEELFSAKLTTGMDINPDGTVTARWHRLKDGCDLSVSFTMPMKRSAAPLDIWLEVEPLVKQFTLAISGIVPYAEDDGQTAEGVFVELLDEPGGG